MNKRKPISAVFAGLIIAGLTILFALITTVLGGAGSGGLGIFQYLLIIVALAVLVNVYGKSNGYDKSFGDLFSYGFKATAIYTLIFLAFLLILLSLSPDLKQKTIDSAREEMQKKGSSQKDIDDSIAIVQKYFWIGIVGGTMFFLVLVGAIGSLIGAAITKKIPHHPVDQPDL